MTHAGNTKARTLPRIPSAVATKLGYYVYLYINPIDGKVFYVGKGRGNRAFAHLHTDERREIHAVIGAIRATGAEPRIEILAHGLRDAETALRIEAAAIDLLGLDNLTNVVCGWHETKFGRTPIDELVGHYTRRPAKIKEPAILIRINRTYHYGMSEAELYDATRSSWKVGLRRRAQAKLALSVYRDVVREVYCINGWKEAGTTFNGRFAQGRAPRHSDRWEFIGTVADEKLRRRYLNRYVGHLFSPGAQNPITYINID